MSPDRAAAYRKVMHTLAELGPAKLLEAEQQRIRLAADNLIFSRALEEDVEAQEAIDDVERLCRALVDSGRWEQRSAAQLAEDLIECGPERVELFEAA
jgi:hypothetical protein